jgi:hypothetical protein
MAWKHDPSGYFSVKLTYFVLHRFTVDKVTFFEEEARKLPKV